MSLNGVDGVVPEYRIAAEELRPNPGQWQVYESTGHCIAVAGPGSGKTKTLTTKLARMLNEDVRPPRGVACITYSHECARELMRRLERLGVSESPNLFLGTVHGFCLAKILTPFASLGGLGLPEPLNVATSQEQRESFQRASRLVFGRGRGVSRTQMDWYRRTYLDREGSDWRADEEETFNLIEAYEHELRSHGLIDFDDMVLSGLRLVEDCAWVRQSLSARYPILVVDEYQDLGVPLHRIVMSLCFGGGIRLLAVGDPDQSIYGFNGARPELLRDLSRRTDVQCVKLRLNYRCGSKIVRASEIVLDAAIGSFATPDTAPTGTVAFHKFPGGIEEQAAKICSEIIPSSLARRVGRGLGDIAVLYVDRNDGDVIAKAAVETGLDTVRIDGNAPYQKTALTRWLEDCAEWCCGGWRFGRPRLASLIHIWLTFYGQSNGDEGLALGLKRRLTCFLWDHRGAELGLCDWLRCMQSECLSDAFFPGCCMAGDYEAMIQMIAAASAHGVFAGHTLASFTGQGGASDHLNLITLHSSKGREFEVVVMMGMDQGRIPWVQETASGLAEKRRLFYVGLTRAKQEVHLIYSGWYSDRYRGRCHLGASQYLRELGQRLSEQYSADAV